MTTQRIRLTIIALIVCIVALASLVLLHQRASDEATALVMDVNSRALSGWDPQPVISQAHELLLADAGAEFFDTYFRALRRLGTLQEIRDIRFDMALGAPWQLYRSGSASYTMNAIFSNGQAEVRISLIRDQSQWRISEYLVLTPALAS